MDVYWIDYIIIDIHEATNSTGSPFWLAFYSVGLQLMSMYVDACGLFILSDAKKEHVLIFSIDTVKLNFEEFHNLMKYLQYKNLHQVLRFM